MVIKYLDFHKYLEGMNKQVLLLNQDSSPLNIITIGKAFKLLIRDKVYWDASDEDCHEVVSISKIIKIPKILILKYYVKLPYRKAPPSRKNIFRRDNYCCQYCGTTLHNENATIDHITPRCKGGSSSWINMVTSCKKCNLFKGSKTLKEAKMELKNKPKEPSYGFLFESMLITFRKQKNA
jgi:5-methylcytosine-specific restriction endonuclease McrA